MSDLYSAPSGRRFDPARDPLEEARSLEASGHKRSAVLFHVLSAHGLGAVRRVEATLGYGGRTRARLRA